MYKRMINKRRKHVLLTLTHACNLSCVYCYERYKSHKSMPLSTAISEVERHLNDSEGFDEIEFEFSGGEPFLEFETIRNVCEKTWRKCQKLPYIFFATTNGTLVHGEIKEWVKAHRDRIALALSIDGTKAMQDRNRSYSFDRIDLDFFLKTWPYQPVKMTVSNYTLPYLAEGVQFLHSLGAKIQNNLAYGVDWRDSKNIYLLSREMNKLISFYLENSNIEPCSLFSMELKRVAVQANDIKKWCGVGSEMVAIDIDGSEYPCHMFQPVSMWRKYTDIAGYSFDPVTLKDDMCDGCILFPICPTCYGINFMENDNPATRNKTLCTLTKVRALACSKLQALLLQKMSEACVDENEAFERILTIRATELIQSSVQIENASQKEGGQNACFT